MRSIAARASASLAAALLTLAVALPASAQQPAPPPPPDEAELTTFTEAYLDIEAIGKEAEASIAAAQTEEEKAQIRQAKEEKSAAVLEKRQIEKDRYVAIANLLNTNPELKAQFEALREKIIEERKKSSG